MSSGLPHGDGVFSESTHGHIPKAKLTSYVCGGGGYFLPRSEQLDDVNGLSLYLLLWMNGDKYENTMY